MAKLEITLSAKLRFWAKPALVAMSVVCALVSYASKSTAKRLAAAAGAFIGAHGFTFTVD